MRPKSVDIDFVMTSEPWTPETGRKAELDTRHEREEEDSEGSETFYSLELREGRRDRGRVRELSGMAENAANEEEVVASADTAEEPGTYYVVKMANNGGVCVVNRDQLQPREGEEVAVGSTCEVGEEGGETQPAVIIGAGTESALSLLESCIKQVTPLSVSGDSQSVEGCGGGGERKDDRVMWGSELAALLSPTLNPTASPNTNTTTTPSKINSQNKRSVSTSAGSATKRRKLDLKQSSTTVVGKTVPIPTVVPSKPLLVGGGRGGASPNTNKQNDDKDMNKLSREVPPPEKTDPISQILHEVKEIRRSYSTLAGSLLIMKRNQEDIKNRLTEIGLSIVTNSSDPLLLTSDPALQTTPTNSIALGPSSTVETEEGVVVGGEVGLMDKEEVVAGDPDHPHTLRGINVAATFPEFDPEYLVVTRGKSCSRRNFAVNLVRYLYTPEEMAQSNCSGTRGKLKLEQERLAIVRRATLTLWPMDNRLQEPPEWTRCIYSIDEACRRLNRPKMKKKEIVREDDSINLETEVESFIVGGASQM